MAEPDAMLVDGEEETKPILLPQLQHAQLLPPPPPSSTSSSSTSHPPPTTGTSTASTNAASTASTVKPASKATKPKRRSPSPTPPPPVIPLQTIRISIALGGPENYEVDIANLARLSGQRPTTPVRVPRPSEHFSSSSEDEAAERGINGVVGVVKKAKGKKKKAHTGAEYYDVNDPFIDDSELALDERTYFGQTKQHGFYVSSGQVALKIDPSSKKAKSRRLFANLDIPPSASALPSNLTAIQNHALAQAPAGTKDEPIPLLDDDNDNDNDNHNNKQGSAEREEVGQKRKRYTTVMENGKKRKIVDIKSFHPSLQSSLAMLKKAIDAESWTEKGKFPPALKPLLAEVALEAVRLGEYDDHFFSLMPTLFPYNKFTMTKLIKRTIFAEHTALLIARQDELLQELGELAREGLAKAEEDWKKNYNAWLARQPTTDTNGNTPTNMSTASASAHEPTPTEMELQDNDDAHYQQAHAHAQSISFKDHGPGHGGNGKETKDLANNPPGKKYRLTEKMKSLVWQLVLLSNQCGAMENEKNGLEQSTLLVSEQALRKILYQKIISVFPPGWMTSNHLSRDVSAIKKRLEREANDDVMQE